MTTKPREFWGQTPNFTYRNTAMLFGIRHSSTCVLDGNILPNAMNGSLWTLPDEIKLYILLGNCSRDYPQK